MLSIEKRLGTIKKDSEFYKLATEVLSELIKTKRANLIAKNTIIDLEKKIRILKRNQNILKNKSINNQANAILMNKA